MSKKLTAILLTVLIVFGSIGLYQLLCLAPLYVRIVVAAVSILLFYRVVLSNLDDRETTDTNVNDQNSR